jgi:hypothetical protein
VNYLLKTMIIHAAARTSNAVVFRAGVAGPGSVL